jgi:succinate-semialdehyde dehydrogenase/glutarate-semialdehyde dehydrogenase
MATTVDMGHTRLLVGGDWVDGEHGERIDVLDPATQEPFATVADATVGDGLAAVDAAAAALPGWRARPPRERAEILRRGYELMTERAEGLAELITRENGKALPDSRAEVAYAAEFFRWYSEEAPRVAGSVGTAPGGDKRIVVIREPVGVAVLVTPWNFPAAMATRKIAPALAAGCAVVLKPASLTPLTALAVADLLVEAGVPAGVLNVVTSRRAGPLVSALLHDPRVRKLSFTGSTEVGRLLLKEAANTVVNCSMELGGNAPFVVLDDADLDAAVQGALVAKMRNAGEACTAANRFYVHESVASDFASRLAAAMGALRVGNGLTPGVEVGPLVDEGTRDKVELLVADAVDRGGRVRCGARRGADRGYFYQPTVLEAVTPDAAILREEIFGPVAPVVAFSCDDEVVDLANDTEYGLAAYLYTRDLGRGLRMAEALETGMIGLNRGLLSDPAAPFGGVKQSGIGREGASDGILDYLETKYIAASW